MEEESSLTCAEANDKRILGGREELRRQDACTDEHLALTHLQWGRGGEGWGTYLAHLHAVGAGGRGQMLGSGRRRGGGRGAHAGRRL